MSNETLESSTPNIADSEAKPEANLKDTFELMKSLPQGYFEGSPETAEQAEERLVLARELYDNLEVPPLLDLPDTPPLSLQEALERRAHGYWMEHALEFTFSQEESDLLSKMELPKNSPPQLESWALAKAHLADLLQRQKISMRRFQVGPTDDDYDEGFRLQAIAHGEFRVEVRDGKPEALAMDYSAATRAALDSVKGTHEALRDKYPILRKWPRVFRTYRFIHDAAPYLMRGQLATPGFIDVAAMHYLVRDKEDIESGRPVHHS